MHWMIDRWVNLTEVCMAARWHRPTAVEALEELGFPLRDAEAFVAFAFADHVAVKVRAPAEHLTDDQSRRLSLASEGGAR